MTERERELNRNIDRAFRSDLWDVDNKGNFIPKTKDAKIEPEDRLEVLKRAMLKLTTTEKQMLLVSRELLIEVAIVTVEMSAEKKGEVFGFILYQVLEWRSPNC